MRVTIQIGGKARPLKFGSEAAQDVCHEVQRLSLTWLPQRLQIADIAQTMQEKGDRGLIQVFLRHGLYEDKNVTASKIYRWIDEAVEAADDPDEAIQYLTTTIGDALEAARLIKREAVAPSEDASQAAADRPTGGSLKAVQSGSLQDG